MRRIGDPHIEGRSWPAERAAETLPRLRRANDAEGIRAFVEANPLATWYGCVPASLRLILDGVGPSAQGPATVTSALRAFVNGRDPLLRAVPGKPLAQPPSADPPRSPHSALERPESPAGAERGTDADGFAPEPVWPELLSAIRRRLLGHPRDAAARLASLHHRFPALTAAFDLTGGVAAFAALEQGNAQMLAGDFTGALVTFHRVFGTPLSAHPYLLRDARAKAALLHALYGDVEQAASHLDIARQIPRTESWAESFIDAITATVEALLGPAEESLDWLNRIPAHHLGAMWPFHAAALFNVYSRAGRFHEMAVRLAVKTAARTVAEQPEGIAGSAMPLTMARLMLASGEMAVARTHLERADPELVLSRLTSAQLSVAAGQPREALRELSRLRADTLNFRRLDVARAAALAASLIQLGEFAQARREATRADQDWGGLSEAEIAGFPPAIQEFLSTARAEASRGGGLGALPGTGPDITPRLTKREREVLVHLTTGASRKLIANALFVSENTVKTHQRALFKKLGVATRTEAIAVAARMGLIAHAAEGTSEGEP